MIWNPDKDRDIVFSCESWSPSRRLCTFQIFTLKAYIIFHNQTSAHVPRQCLTVLALKITKMARIQVETFKAFLGLHLNKHTGSSSICKYIVIFSLSVTSKQLGTGKIIKTYSATFSFIFFWLWNVMSSPAERYFPYSGCGWLKVSKKIQLFSLCWKRHTHTLTRKHTQRHTHKHKHYCNLEAMFADRHIQIQHREAY